MFDSPAKKLMKLANQIEKAIDSRNKQQIGELFKKACELMNQSEEETSLDFLTAQQAIAIKLLAIKQYDQSMKMIGQIIARTERLGHDRTAFYAMCCHVYAHLVHGLAPGSEMEGREALEKGFRRALEGDKEQLIRLTTVIDGYLSELKEYRLNSWIPRFFESAKAAFDGKVGETLPTAHMLLLFAAALADSDSAENRAKALAAVDRVLQIMAASKFKPEDQLNALILKSRLLCDLGRAAEAVKFLRGAMSTAQGGGLLVLATNVADTELGLGRDPQQVAMELDRFMGRVTTRLDAESKAYFYGVKGYCVAMRGEETTALDCAARLLACRSEKRDPEKDSIDELVATELDHIALALLYGCGPESALRLNERAAAIAANLEGKLPEAKQTILATKVDALARAGRGDEAEAIIHDEILEKLDDENLLDTSRHAETLILLASVCIGKGEYERARKALKNAWAMSAEHDGATRAIAGRIYIWMGKLMMLTGQVENAKEALDRGRETLLAHGSITVGARVILNEYGC